jgi:hypothetical protein
MSFNIRISHRKREISYSFKFFCISHFSMRGAIFCSKHSHRNGLLVWVTTRPWSRKRFSQEYAAVNGQRGNEIASRAHQPRRNLLLEIQRGRDICSSIGSQCWVLHSLPERRSDVGNESRICFSAEASRHKGCTYGFRSKIFPELLTSAPDKAEWSASSFVLFKPKKRFLCVIWRPALRVWTCWRRGISILAVREHFIIVTIKAIVLLHF